MRLLSACWSRSMCYHVSWKPQNTEKHEKNTFPNLSEAPLALRSGEPQASFLYINIYMRITVCKYIYIQIYIYIWWLIKIPLSANDHSSRSQMLLSRNCRELHVYLSRGQCWATTPLMKIRSPPAKLRQRITDHFLIAFLNMQLASRNPFSGQIVAD